jgi:site-specific DNA-adenine methylase
LNALLFQFAANYAQDKLIHNINEKVIELKNILAGKASTYANELTSELNKKDDKKTNEKSVERRKSFRKVVSASLTDDYMKKAVEVTDPELLDKLDSISPITREVKQYK